ncbi:MAG: hypothetical protein IKP88_12780 [Lachnospiraceae bacterium]|nr:hypothetical protein [Lachnospiraceae bacterium]
MFKIENYDSNVQCKTFELNENLFHEALKEELKSLARFHVKNSKGEDFDIVYYDNNDDIEPIDRYPKYVKPPYMTKYLTYDENDKESLWLDFFDGITDMAFEELNEYTIVLTKIVLKYTDINVFTHDSRIYWFIPADERLYVMDEFPEDLNEETLIYIQNEIRIGIEDMKFRRLSNTYAFHNVFFMQWILNGKPLSNYKFITIPINDVGGIGSILTYYKRYQTGFKRFGLSYTSDNPERMGKYKKEMLDKYFAVNLQNPEATDENTLTVPYLVILAKTKFLQSITDNVDESIIGEEFKTEMNEYYDAVFGSKKVLGILIRGTDYITTGLPGDRKMATVDQMKPKIHKWIEEYGFEKLFLATEDENILEQMREEFGSMLVALSQERLRVSDLREGQVISEYEKENNKDAYDDKLEDTTVNYFYALYILSRCDSFMCSGQCNGWDFVRSLNNGRFNNVYKFAVGLKGDPETEEWKEIRPIFAGMFARGTYPTGKAFFMTYRFDLAENVNPDALKAAWDATMSVYPYMTYAVLRREDRFVLTENPLPFIIEETEEVIEPFGKTGNYHTTCLCYKGSSLWIYMDHVPVDGTGAKMILETFFYHYYCELDQKKYAVPEGVFTADGGMVPGQDTDAYLMVDAIDPMALMKDAGQPDTFVMPETVSDKPFAEKQNCRGYCITVSSEEFMGYAKSIGANPTALLTIAYAKAVQKVNPENTKDLCMMNPISVRKAMGNENSLLHQVVHSRFSFKPGDLMNKSDTELSAVYRGFLRGYTSTQNIHTMCSVYRGIIEGYFKAFKFGVLDKIIIEQRMSPATGGMLSMSYLGSFRAAEYADRIKMKAFHVMQERGIMIQTTEVGGVFYIDWYQGFTDDKYARAMTEMLISMGMKSAKMERVE